MIITTGRPGVNSAAGQWTTFSARTGRVARLVAVGLLSWLAGGAASFLSKRGWRLTDVIVLRSGV